MPVPTGAVTFLFADIEGSTRLWETYPDDMPQAFQQQETLIRQAMANHGGYVYKMIGDAFQVAFSSAAEALEAAIEAQTRLHAAHWGSTGPIRVRMGLHTGVTEERGDDYVGPELNRAARLTSAGHGGQILLSQATYELVQHHLTGGVTLHDLGEHWLKDLRQPEHLYQVVAPGLPVDFPPLRTLDFIRGNLPQPATAFIGRENELAQIETCLASQDCRLITLVGLGGSGKTRLAIQAGWQSRAYHNNACFVSLVNAQTLDDILVAIAEAIRFKLQAPAGQSLSASTAQAQLIQYLSDKQALLILDNFEQLIPYLAFVDALLLQAPRIKVLATSRERLNLPGEWVLEIAGLAFPGESDLPHPTTYAAIQLFIQGAQRAAGYQYNPFDWPAIAKICRLVEGIPLGIEMATGWLKVFTCQEIAAEIDQDLDFLSAAWRGAPERHQSLRAVFEYSWRLLTHFERQGFMRLGIFQSRFDRQAAKAVAGLSTANLAALIDKSLLSRAGANGWYEIHPLLARFVREKLAANPTVLEDVTDRYILYFMEWFRAAAEALKGPEQASALQAIRLEMPDLHATFAGLIEAGNLARVMEILPGLLLFNFMNDQRLVSEALTGLLRRLHALLENSPSAEPSLALLASALSFLTAQQGALEESALYEKRALELIGNMPDQSPKALTLLLLAMLNSKRPGSMSQEQEIAFIQESQALFSRLEDAWGVALAGVIRGDCTSFGQNDPASGSSYYQASLEGFTRLQNDWGRSICLTGLMTNALHQSDPERALRLGNQALDILRRLENRERMVWVNDLLAWAATQQGFIEQACAYYQDNLAIFTDLGDESQKQSYLIKIKELSTLP